MTNIDTVGKKLKGKLQQVQGKIEVATGHQIKGNVDQLRGKATELEADIESNIDDAAR